MSTITTPKCDCGSTDIAVIYYDQPLCIVCYRAGGGTQLAAVPRDLHEAMDWFYRELHFAFDAHEFPASLKEKVDEILVSDAPEEYRKAAQLIACTRNTCGGPNAAHEHQPFTPENAS